MGKWVPKIMEQPDMDEIESETHIPVKGIAALVDGTITRQERQNYIAHLNHCPYCYKILEKTLEDISLNNIFVEENETSRIIPVSFYKIAASIMLFVLVGSGVYMNYYPSYGNITTSFVLDQGFKSILLENKNTRWEDSDRINRLKTLLIAKGVDVKSISKVHLESAYNQKKSLFVVEEQIIIRIEDGTAFIQVKAKDGQ